MKITKDLFVWKIISHELAAHFYYREDSPEVYVLHDDDSETLIDSEEILLDAYYDKSILGIEVGELDFHDLAKKQDIIPVFWSKDDVIGCAHEQEVLLTDDEIEQVCVRLERFHDATIGINWDVIKCQIQMLIDERGN